MPKKKEPLSDDETSIDVLALGHKKHKKHKHKKHKKKRGLEDDGDGSGGGSPGTPSDNFKHGLKLKIKIGGQTFGEARVAKSEINEASSDESGNIDVVDPSPANMSDSLMSQANSKKGKKVDDDDAWLEALEEGRLEEVDEELRRMKDPNLMTARQRSLLESKAQKEKEEIAPAVETKVVLSEEMIQQRMMQAKKRKKLAEEKKEKDKKQTIERLLKKPDTKPRTMKKVVKKVEVPKMKYIDNEFKGRSLSFPVGFTYPLKAQTAKEPPPVILCGVKGCENKKKYSCSKTGVPLCSLACYKKNMILNSNTTSVILVS